MPLGVNNKQRSITASYDALLDILVATVGIMLVFVLFTVISSQGEMRSLQVGLKIYAPILRGSDNTQSSLLVICSKGQARILDMKTIADRINQEAEASAGSSQFVKSLEGKVYKDDYFSYTLKTYADIQSIVQRKGAAPIIIASVSPLADRGGASTSNGDDHAIFSALAKHAQNEGWVHFLVDEGSIGIYHQLSAFARKRGALVGWEPYNVTFPFIECPFGCGGAQSDFQLIRGYQRG